MIYPVTIRKHDSCFTYALKRVGLDFDFNLRNSAETYLKTSTIEDLDSLQKGDLLYYSRPLTDKNVVTIAGSITVNREVIQERVCYNLHFAVYEGNGLVSELIRIDDSHVFEINLVRLKDINHVDWKVIKHPLNI